VLAGNAPDNEGALALVEEVEQNCEVVAAETVADCAFGDGATRQQCADGAASSWPKWRRLLYPGHQRERSANAARLRFAVEQCAPASPRRRFSKRPALFNGAPSSPATCSIDTPASRSVKPTEKRTTVRQVEHAPS